MDVFCNLFEQNRRDKDRNFKLLAKDNTEALISQTRRERDHGDFVHVFILNRLNNFYL
jgi:hypothetical protein